MSSDALILYDIMLLHLTWYWALFLDAGGPNRPLFWPCRDPRRPKSGPSKPNLCHLVAKFANGAIWWPDV